jgi:hypothetical protein
MNVPIMDEISRDFDYPEIIESTYDFDSVTCCKYGHQGQFLFLGSNTGHVLMYVDHTM